MKYEFVCLSRNVFHACKMGRGGILGSTDSGKDVGSVHTNKNIFFPQGCSWNSYIDSIIFSMLNQKSRARKPFYFCPKSQQFVSKPGSYSDNYLLSLCILFPENYSLIYIGESLGSFDLTPGQCRISCKVRSNIKFIPLFNKVRRLNFNYSFSSSRVGIGMEKCCTESLQQKQVCHGVGQLVIISQYIKMKLWTISMQFLCIALLILAFLMQLIEVAQYRREVAELLWECEMEDWE